MTSTSSADTVFEHLRRLVTFTVPTDDELSDDFPRTEWDNWQTLCSERWDFFTGKAWEETSRSGSKDGVRALKYPIAINPIKTFALKHAYTLFGEVPDNAFTLVQPKLRPKADTTEAKNIALEAERALERIYWENHMRSLMSENAVLSQFLDGCVFKVGWDPGSPLRPSGVRIERVIPDYFIGVPNGSDMWNLREAWVIRPITPEEARNVYNVSLGEIGLPETVLLIEHWTQNRYRVSIEGKTAALRLRNGELYRLSGKNQFGIVPFVWIPHERAGGMHGMSHVDSLKNLSKEYNARVADAADAVAAESRARLIMRNVPQGVKHTQVDSELIAINLGMAAPGGEQPELEMLKTPSVTASMNDFNDRLFAQLRRDGFVPPVADGEDEGSQRSALTLAFRMWPLTSHVRSERNYWTDGLNMLAEIALIVLTTKNPLRLDEDPELGHIGRQHLGHMKSQEWAPMLPRDREQLVNEMVLRMQAYLVSPETAMEELGDIEDESDEMIRIREWAQVLAKIQQTNKPQGAPTDTNAPVAKSLTE